MNREIEIATIIRSQIGIWPLASCGARKFVALDENESREGGLRFQITIKPREKHWIEVDLQWNDEYAVRLVTFPQMERVIINEFTGVYCDQLADLIYDLGNKPEYYDPAMIARLNDLEETQQLTAEMYNFGALRRRQSRFEAVPGFQYAYAVKGRSLDMCARRRPLLDYSNAGERIAYLKWELKRLEDSFGYTHEWMHSRVKGASSVNQKKVFLMEGRQILDGLYLAKYEVLKALARQA